MSQRMQRKLQTKLTEAANNKTTRAVQTPRPSTPIPTKHVVSTHQRQEITACQTARIRQASRRCIVVGIVRAEDEHGRADYFLLKENVGEGGL